MVEATVNLDEFWAWLQKRYENAFTAELKEGIRKEFFTRKGTKFFCSCVFDKKYCYIHGGTND